MQRSAAPSATKKPRFMPPYASIASKEGYVTKLGQHRKESSEESTHALQNPHGTAGNTECAAAGYKYFNVMWCKLSKKKHKTWEGDAILVIMDQTALLKDMEGKDIAKGTLYKSKELSGLSEGSTLTIGGKEIEVMSEISADDWKAGKCFTGVGPATAAKSIPRCLTSVNTSKKGFCNPVCVAESQELKFADTPVPGPLHNPSGPDALVMPRPNAKHQMDYNQRGLGLVDVVVDPHLSRHLRPHQREGVVFLYECLMNMREFPGSGAILADEMGLGKTLQCITVLWTLLKQGPYGRKAILKRAVIVTPGSLCKNWACEFKKWLGSERLRVFVVTPETRVEEFVKSPIYPMLVISYEMFLRTYERLKAVKFDIVICDEGHRLKNVCAKTTSLLMSISTRKRVVLTGTPIQNNLQELYSIIEFCNPGLLGTHAAFRRVYEEPIVQSRQPTATLEEREIGEMRANELNRLINLFCLRRTQEINQKYLPSKTSPFAAASVEVTFSRYMYDKRYYPWGHAFADIMIRETGVFPRGRCHAMETVVFCQMAPLQLVIYRYLLKSCLLQEHTPNSPLTLACIGALRKLCNSPSLLYNAAAETQTLKCSGHDTDQSLYDGVLPLYPSEYDPLSCTIEHSGKLSVLSSMLEYLHSKTDEKIVLVSNYTKTLDLLQRFCQEKEYGFLRLDGSTPTSKRQHIIEHFNSSHCQQSVFLLSSKAGGTGLNLTGASRLVLYDIDWNPANDLQAMARVWRDGQKRKVFIYQLLTTGSIEEKIYQRQITKQGLSTVVEGCSGETVKFSIEDLKDLFTLDEATLCNTHDLLNCNCVDKVNEISNCGDSGRGCQLGCSSNYNKHVSMDELLKWKHHCYPLDARKLDDAMLLESCSGITFAFQSETS